MVGHQFETDMILYLYTGEKQPSHKNASQTAQKVVAAVAAASINNSTAVDYKNIVKPVNIADDADVPPLV